MGNFINELRNFQNVPRELVFDKTLSDRARFVYVFMACKPEDWDFFLAPMANEIGYSVDTLRKYINELVESGWLVKGEQQKEKGMFSAVEYTLKATKNTESEKVRDGKNHTQHNIDIIQTRDDDKEKNEIDKSISKKADDLFETCWIAYRRKGSKKKAKEYWNKLTDDEKASVLPHVKAYTASRELAYQKDFERYLRDKIFLTVVFARNSILFDPDMTQGNEYKPICDGGLLYNEKHKCYIYIGYYNGYIPDGYDDNDRPNGATVMLNNGRGNVVWNSKTKKWEKKDE